MQERHTAHHATVQYSLQVHTDRCHSALSEIVFMLRFPYSNYVVFIKPLLSNTVTLFSAYSVTHQVSHPQKQNKKTAHLLCISC